MSACSSKFDTSLSFPLHTHHTHHTHHTSMSSSPSRAFRTSTLPFQSTQIYSPTYATYTKPTITAIPKTNTVDTIIIQRTSPPPSSTDVNNHSATQGPSSISTGNDRTIITIMISFLVILFLLALLFIYIRRKRKRHQQDNVLEAGEMPRSALPDSPSPPPPPPPPPPTPTPLPLAILGNDENIQQRSPRYKITTLQIEPMTKRLTMNLSQKGKSMIINEDKSSSQARRSRGEGGESDEDVCQEIINVVSLRDGDDDDEGENEEGSGEGGSRFSNRFSFRKSFWK